jgi:hypothetical protein
MHSSIAHYYFQKAKTKPHQQFDHSSITTSAPVYPLAPSTAICTSSPDLAFGACVCGEEAMDDALTRSDGCPTYH